jgi:hypothetical protein
MRAAIPGSLLTVSAAAIFVAGCGNAPGIPENSIETLDQRIKRQEAEFNATPDIQVPELRERLRELGVADAWITPAIEENGVEVLLLRVPNAAFARLDKRALAKLVLDSRYRFEFVDMDQIHEFALYQGAESHARAKAKALRELAERGQLNSFPRYRAGMPMTAYAPMLETWCGYRKGEALAVIDGKWLDYQRRMVDMAAENFDDGRALASFDCIKRVVDATDLRRHFIGNRGREGAIDY